MAVRVEWIDVAKGIGIILVVLGHVLVGLSAASIYSNYEFLRIPRDFIWVFHMHLFFFLAGILVVKSLMKRGRFQFFVNKIQFILYPYIIWSIIQGVLQATLANFTNSSIHYTDILAILYRPLPNQHFWFLYVLLMFYMVVILFYFNRISLFILFLISFFLMYHHSFVDLRIFKKFNMFMFFFFLGLIYDHFKCERFLMKIVHNINIYIIICLSIIYVIFYYKYKSFEYVRPLISLYGVILIVVISMNISKLSWVNFLKIIGAHTLAIYLAHSIFLAGSRIVLYNVFGVENLFIHVVVGTILGITMPLYLSLMSNRYNFKYLFVCSK